jgi:hypothetical protein
MSARVFPSALATDGNQIAVSNVPLQPRRLIVSGCRRLQAMLPLL